jgi:hypothetical protein
MKRIRKAGRAETVPNPEGNKPLGTPRYRWEYNIKTNLREIVFGDVN